MRQREIHTPCILITAFNTLEYSREAINSNANYLLEKPFSYQSLRQTIEKIILNPTSLQHCVDRGLALVELGNQRLVAGTVQPLAVNHEVSRPVRLDHVH